MNRMSMPSWDRIKAVFAEACELPAEQVPAFLDRVCEGDAEMRREVESLLAARSGKQVATGGAARELAAASTMRAAVITEGAGTVIGPYKLLQLIGEGGFGSVFLAEQTQPVRRRVAVKIIKLGMDTKQVIARFEAERQALALMDHPHIAKVLDGGATPLTERGGGRPYFVMEYVVGDAITAFADAHKLTIRDRLDLFQQVCSAVQHAHTKGIIHRDLKPGNVLVTTLDGKPFAKVIDFGIAKATAGPGGLTDRTLFTEHRQLIGTPEYMSPEQAVGSPDIDTRTDVYALGVLLYELLTGQTPFDGARLRSAAYAEIQRIIKEEEPPSPSQRLSRSLDTIAATAAARQIEPEKLRVSVHGELDWIVMRALDKERTRRYESASALADDVRRHLAGEAVVAAPVSNAYRLRKFVRRNKGAVGAVSAVVLALSAGLSVAAWQWQRAQSFNAEAEQYAGEAAFNATRATLLMERATVQRDFAARAARAAQATLMGDSDSEDVREVERIAALPEPVPGPYDPEVAKTDVGLAMKELAVSTLAAARTATRQRQMIQDALETLYRPGDVIQTSDQAHTFGFLSALRLRDDYAKVPEEDRRVFEVAEMAKFMTRQYSTQLEAAEWSAYTANIALAQAAIEAGDYPEARNRAASTPSSKRAWEWALVDHEARSVVWSRNEPLLQCVALSPDATELAIASYGSIGIYRVSDGTQLRTLKISASDGPPSLADMSYSADGRYLVAARTSGGSAFLIDAMSGGITYEFGDLPGSCWSVAISPDGQTVATSSRSQIDFWDANTGQHISQCDVPIAQKFALTVRYASAGNRLLMQLNDEQLVSMDCHTCELTAMSEDERTVVLGRAFNRRWSVGPNAAGVVTGTRYGGVSRNDSMSLDKFLLVQDASTSSSPTSDLIFFKESDATLVSLRIAAILASSPSVPSSLTITTPDGTRRIVGGADKTVRFYEAKDGEPTLPATAESPEGVYREVAVFRMPEAVTNLQMTGDGTRLIIHLEGGSARVWDIRDPEERRKDLQAEWAERVPAGAYLDAMWNTTNSDGSLAVPDDKLRDAVINDASLTPLRRLVAVEMLEERVEGDRLAVEQAFAAVTKDQTDKAAVQAAAAARTDLPKRVHAQLIAKAAEWEYKQPEPSDAERLVNETKQRRLAEATLTVERFQSWDTPNYPGNISDLERAVATRDELLGEAHLDSTKARWMLGIYTFARSKDLDAERNGLSIMRRALSDYRDGAPLSDVTLGMELSVAQTEFWVGNLVQAEASLRRALADVERDGRSDLPKLELTFSTIDIGGSGFEPGFHGKNLIPLWFEYNYSLPLSANRDRLLRELRERLDSGLVESAMRVGTAISIVTRVRLDGTTLRYVGGSSNSVTLARLQSDDARVFLPLALHYCRNEQFAEALGALAESVRLCEVRPPADDGWRPSRCNPVLQQGTLALIRHRISASDPITLAAAGEIDGKHGSLTGGKVLDRDGHRVAAREALARAKALMLPAADGTPSPWANDEDAKALIAEAEELIGGAP